MLNKLVVLSSLLLVGACSTAPQPQNRVWTFEMPDGKLEQYQVAPIG